MKNIDALIKQIDALAPVSPIVHRVMQIAASREVAVEDLATVVEHDPALTANLLRICNSAYYGFAVHVDSVHHAVALLGCNEVIGLVLVNGAGFRVGDKRTVLFSTGPSGPWSGRLLVTPHRAPAVSLPPGLFRFASSPFAAGAKPVRSCSAIPHTGCCSFRNGRRRFPGRPRKGSPPPGPASCRNNRRRPSASGRRPRR